MELWLSVALAPVNRRREFASPPRNSTANSSYGAEWTPSRPQMATVAVRGTAGTSAEDGLDAGQSLVGADRLKGCQIAVTISPASRLLMVSLLEPKWAKNQSRPLPPFRMSLAPSSKTVDELNAAVWVPVLST